MTEQRSAFRIWIPALLAGSFVGYADLGATEVQGPLLLLMLAAFLLAMPGVGAAWGIAAAESLAFTAVHVGARAFGHDLTNDSPWGTLIAFAPILAAAYAGRGAGLLVRRAADAVPRGHAEREHPRGDVIASEAIASEARAADATTRPATARDAPDAGLPWYARPAGSRPLLAASLLGVAVLGAGPVYASLAARGQPVAWWVTTIWQIVTLLGWVMLAPSIIARRGDALRPADLARAALAVLALVVAHAVGLVVLTRLLFIPSGPASVLAAVLWAIAAYLPLDVLVIALLQTLGYASDVERHERERAAEAERRDAALRAEVQSSRLAALRAQLRPHFFLNALNAASTLARRSDTAAVTELLGKLGDLLRYVLADRGDLVPLAEELAFVEEYLAVERVRFPERLRPSVEADDDARAALVPPLLLQALVENALRHGIAARLAAGEVRVRAWTERAGDAAPSVVHLTVEDDGPGPGSGDGSGLGLPNAGARLAALFGDAARLTLAEREGGGTIAHVVMPWRRG